MSESFIISQKDNYSYTCLYQCARQQATLIAADYFAPQYLVHLVGEDANWPL